MSDYVEDSRFGAGLGRRIAPGRLGNFWDDLYRVAGTVQQAATAGREITAGNAKVTVVPTQQGLTNYVSEAASTNAVPMVLIAGAALAVFLATRPKGRRRR